MTLSFRVTFPGPEASCPAIFPDAGTAVRAGTWLNDSVDGARIPTAQTTSANSSSRTSPKPEPASHFAEGRPPCTYP